MHLGICSKPMSRSRPDLGLIKTLFSKCDGQSVKHVEMGSLFEQETLNITPTDECLMFSLQQAYDGI